MILRTPKPESAPNEQTTAYYATPINEQIFAGLQKIFDTLPELDRYVILMFDEILCSDVNPSWGKLCAGATKPPTHAILFGIQAAKDFWYQPLGCMFWHKDQGAERIADVIRLLVDKLHRCGITVVCSVSPPYGGFIAAIEMLTMNLDITSKDVPIYSVLNKVNDIVHIYDPPTLLRITRDHLKIENAYFTEDGVKREASWEDVTEYYNRCPTRLTQYHISPGYQKSYVTACAAQVFSYTVFMDMKRAVEQGHIRIKKNGTPEFCLFFDTLFDTFNGEMDAAKKNRLPYRTNGSTHSLIWKRAIPILETLEFDYNLPTKATTTGSIRLTKTRYNLESVKRQIFQATGNAPTNIQQVAKSTVLQLLAAESAKAENKQPKKNKKKNKKPYSKNSRDTEGKNTNTNVTDEDELMNTLKRLTLEAAQKCSVDPQQQQQKPEAMDVDFPVQVENIPVIDFNKLQAHYRPTIIDHWITTVRGMEMICKNLEKKGFEFVPTKNFSTDMLHQYMYFIQVSKNGIDRDYVVNTVEKDRISALLDTTLALDAFMPYVGCFTVAPRPA